MYVQTAITVFNKRLGADRREVYFPTCIRSASFLENKSLRPLLRTELTPRASPTS